VEVSLGVVQEPWVSYPSLTPANAVNI